MVAAVLTHTTPAPHCSSLGRLWLSTGPRAGAQAGLSDAPSIICKLDPASSRNRSGRRSGPQSVPRESSPLPRQAPHSSEQPLHRHRGLPLGQAEPETGAHRGVLTVPEVTQMAGGRSQSSVSHSGRGTVKRGDKMT